MRAIPAAVEREVKKALQKSAEAMVEQARFLCPVDEGALRESIGWTFGDAPQGSRMIAGVSEAGITVTVYAGNDEAFYARWVEYGTQAGKIGVRGASPGVGKRGRPRIARKSKRTHPGSAAQPFFFPAYQLEKKRTKSRVKRAMNKAIKAHWGNKR